MSSTATSGWRSPISRRACSASVAVPTSSMSGPPRRRTARSHRESRDGRRRRRRARATRAARSRIHRPSVRSDQALHNPASSRRERPAPADFAGFAPPAGPVEQCAAPTARHRPNGVGGEVDSADLERLAHHRSQRKWLVSVPVFASARSRSSLWQEPSESSPARRRPLRLFRRPSRPSSCSPKPYAYAGLVAANPANGIEAVVTTVARADVSSGHVAGWIGVGSPKAGPAATGRVAPGRREHPGRDRQPALRGDHAAGPPDQVSDARLGDRFRARPISSRSSSCRGNPTCWHVLVNGKPATGAIHLPGSSAFRPMAMGESWNGGSPHCNGFGYRFDQLRVTTHGSWRALTGRLRHLRPRLQGHRIGRGPDSRQSAPDPDTASAHVWPSELRQSRGLPAAAARSCRRPLRRCPRASARRAESACGAARTLCRRRSRAAPSACPSPARSRPGARTPPGDRGTRRSAASVMSIALWSSSGPVSTM